MSIEFLLPAVAGLVFQRISHQPNRIILSLASTAAQAACPECGSESNKLHSRYQRKVTDLPWADRQVNLHLDVRRFFCQEKECNRKVFCERLHPAIAAYARRTKRLDQSLQTLALKLGGEAAALLCQLLNLASVSADTLLKLSRAYQVPAAPSSTVIGIDEWAIRKGCTYATIIVDLEARQPIDLLPDAKVETVEAWLKDHPAVKIVSRDRDTSFADATRKGAPQAVQVADRWHLLKNLGDALKRMLELNQEGLRATAQAMAQEETGNPQASQGQPPSSTAPLQEEVATAPRIKSERRHQQVGALAAKGWSILKIAKHLKMHRQTVKKYMQLDQLPKKHYPPGFGPKRSLSSEQLQYLARRWATGEAKVRRLWKELQDRGYTGSAASIYRAVAHFQPANTAIEAEIVAQATPLSARSAMWLLVKSKEELPEKKQRLLTHLLEHHTHAQVVYPLVQRFTSMVKDRQADHLDGWLEDAKASAIPVLKQFANGLQRDYQAVKAGLSLEWSNGQVEGQINRLKLIKRQAYGRAKLDLLKKRVFFRVSPLAA